MEAPSYYMHSKPEYYKSNSCLQQTLWRRSLKWKGGAVGLQASDFTFFCMALPKTAKK